MTRSAFQSLHPKCWLVHLMSIGKLTVKSGTNLFFFLFSFFGVVVIQQEIIFFYSFSLPFWLSFSNVAACFFFLFVFSLLSPLPPSPPPSLPPRHTHTQPTTHRQGATSRVYKYVLKSDRLVVAACKVVNKNRLGFGRRKKKVLEHIRNEINVLKSLTHPCII